jgi:hypothetical protein
MILQIIHLQPKWYCFSGKNDKNTETGGSKMYLKNSNKLVNS